MPSDPSTAIETIAVLGEPVRRALYQWVVAQPEAVGRDAAAGATGVSRALAAFHLDRLVRDGLLETEFRRLSGRTGPGAGRPAKLYRRAPTTIAVSLPNRDYESAARLLAEAAEQSSDEIPPPAVRSAAHATGLELGSTARRQAGSRASHARRKASLVETLGERGYEPREEPSGDIVLGNCPFDALVDEHRPLVCGMNLALADGVLEGLGDHHLRAELDSQPGRCCVVFHEAGARP